MKSHKFDAKMILEKYRNSFPEIRDDFQDDAIGENDQDVAHFYGFIKESID